jgi:hypothetical protein
MYNIFFFVRIISETQTVNYKMSYMDEEDACLAVLKISLRRMDGQTLSGRNIGGNKILIKSCISTIFLYLC